MIVDKEFLLSIQQQWKTVRDLIELRSRTLLLPGHGYYQEPEPLPEVFNLPLILAFSVLDQVLDQLTEEGKLPRLSGRPMLGAKLKSAQSVLSWLDYDSINTGKEARNSLAHEGKMLPKEACKAYVTAVERELVQWGIVPVAAS